MASENILTLYDSASVSGKPLAWNPFVSKTRYALNFKKIPHRTVWLEYPDIEPTMRSIGAKPTGKHPDGSARYTVPVISDPSHRTSDGQPTVVSDAWSIAEYLDEVYPSPALLFPEGTKALQMLFHDQVWSVMLVPALPILIPLLHDFLNAESRPYWRRTREVYFGAKLEELCHKGTAKWENAWANVQKGFAEVSSWLDKNGKDAGPFVTGNRVTYTDLTIVAILETIFLVVPQDWEDRVKHWDGGRWGKLRDQSANLRIVH